MARNYNFEKIRTLLIEGFDDKELRDFCFDTCDFKSVYHQLAQDTGKVEIIRQLLEYAEQKLLVEQLLAFAKTHNPARYEQDQPYYVDLIASPLKPFEPETILIPAGPFLMGNPEAIGEWQQHPVTLSVYKIGIYPVTNEQYARFAAENPERRPQKAGWRFINPPPDKLNQPVVGVNWDDALVYCEWLSRETGRLYRLPTEAEWEKAFRNAQDFHVASGVREWTSTLWGEDWKKAQFTYPYKNDGRENLKAAPTFYRIYRGGAVYDDTWPDRSIRGCHAPTAYDKNLSFRVALGIDFEG